MALIQKPRVGRVYGTGVSQIQHYPVNGAAVPARGDLVVLTAGLIVVCATDPASILGLVTSKKNQKAGYDMADGVTQVQDRDSTIGVQIANADTQFAMPTSANGSTQGLPSAANIGLSYGIVLISGTFYVNLADTTGPTVIVNDIDILTGTSFVTILPATRQLG